MKWFSKFHQIWRFSEFLGFFGVSQNCSRIFWDLWGLSELFSDFFLIYGVSRNCSWNFSDFLESFGLVLGISPSGLSIWAFWYCVILALFCVISALWDKVKRYFSVILRYFEFSDFSDFGGSYTPHSVIFTFSRNFGSPGLACSHPCCRWFPGGLLPRWRLGLVSLVWPQLLRAVQCPSWMGCCGPMLSNTTTSILFGTKWGDLHKEKSRSSSSLESFKNFDASSELAQLEDRLKMKLTETSRALSCVDAPPHQKKIPHRSRFVSRPMTLNMQLFQ